MAERKSKKTIRSREEVHGHSSIISEMRTENVFRNGKAVMKQKRKLKQR